LTLLSNLFPQRFLVFWCFGSERVLILFSFQWTRTGDDEGLGLRGHLVVEGKHQKESKKVMEGMVSIPE
jgi:hypothetical protein